MTEDSTLILTNPENWSWVGKHFNSYDPIEIMGEHYLVAGYKTRLTHDITIEVQLRKWYIPKTSKQLMEDEIAAVLAKYKDVE